MVAASENRLFREDEMATEALFSGGGPRPVSGEEKLIRAAFVQEFGDGRSPPAIDLVPGMIGPYRIIRRIGAGGMGVVYEAEQAQPARRVALKVTRTPAGEIDPHRFRLFQREIEVLGRLRHASIAQIYEAGQTEDGQQYFVMELIEGQPLTEYCNSAESSLKEKLALFAQICEAVKYAHQRGVIHRDLKPANIMVDDQGLPHVLDFGLARFIDPEMEVTRSLLGGHALLGTLRYMSPEQTRADTLDLDIRTDVYSLGVILFEMLTGRPPYPVTGSMLEVVRHITETDPDRPSSIHRKISNDVETIMLRALAKDRERRYSSADAFGEDVRRYLRGDPIEAKRDSGLYVLCKLAAKHYFHTSVITALVAAIIGFSGICLHSLQQTRAALQQRDVSQAGTQLAYQDMRKFFAQAQDSLREQLLGWFLLEWHEDRLSRARQIRASLQPDTPEYAAMTFLLDERISPDQLQKALPARSDALLQFIVGERLLKSGHRQEAIRAYEQCRGAKDPGYEWFKASATARLEQLGAPRSPESQASVSVEAR